MILAVSTRLRSQELGLAASVGLASLPVYRKLRVAVFFTGDELVMPGEAPGGQLPLAPSTIRTAFAARPARKPGLRTGRLRHRARHARGHPRHAAQCRARERSDHHLGRRVGRRRGSHQA
ncbi:hypothetical protein LP419_00130 [Massilia sp. H-1]|nr:hypothetical protein LP419_00130 [Massilia sp. H-1]